MTKKLGTCRPRLRLHALLKASPFRLVDIAAGTGISKGMLSDYANHRRLPTTRRLFQLATFFGCTLDNLFEEEDRTWSQTRRQQAPYRWKQVPVTNNSPDKEDACLQP